MKAFLCNCWRMFWNWGWILVLGLWVGGFGWYYIAMPKTPLPNEASLETPVVVVLTGGQGRVEKGLKHLKANDNSVMFISGIGHDVSLHQLAEVLKENDASTTAQIEIGDYPRIVLGRAATDTAENASETTAWLHEHGYDSILLVTSYYHIPRSIMEFKHVMPELNIIPSPVVVKQAKGLNGLRLVALEYHKFILRWLYNKLIAIDMRFA